MTALVIFGVLTAALVLFFIVSLARGKARAEAQQREAEAEAAFERARSKVAADLAAMTDADVVRLFGERTRSKP